MKYDPKFPKSSFSGMYRVMSVASEFSKGVFTQTLDIIRLSNQPTMDYIGNGTKDSSKDQRNTDLGLLPITLHDIMSGDPSSLTNALNKVTGISLDALPQASRLINQAAKPLTIMEQKQQNNLADVLANATTVPLNKQNAPDLVPIYQQSQLNTRLPG